jgi:hypothetical protein
MTTADTTMMDRTHIPLLMIAEGKQGEVAPAISQILLIAQENARALEAPEVYPEHVFLTIIALNEEVAAEDEIAQVTESLTALGIDRRMLSTQMRRIFRTWRKRPAQEGASVPLSREVEHCLTWAISLAASLHAPLLRPAHVLLGTMRHPRIQPLLGLLFSGSEIVLPAYMAEETELGYTRSVDQLIHSRIRVQQHVRSPLGVTKRMLSSLERPTLLFADILGFASVKQQLWPVVECLRKPRKAQSPRYASTCGVLLVGAPGNNRSLVARAVAGEAVAPLLYLSLPALVELATATDDNGLDEFDVDLSPEEAAEAQRRRAVERGRKMLRDVFARARQLSPCMLLLDDLDAMRRAEDSVAMQWQKQLIVELDERNYSPAIVAVATSARPDHLDPALLLPGRFDRRIVLDGTVMRAFARSPMLCPSCQHEVWARWKYCAYCGEALATTCSRCGSRLPDVQGAHFCPECGAVVV